MTKYFLTIIGRLAGFYRIAFASVSGNPPVSVIITNPLACNDLTCALSKVTDRILFVAAPITAIMVLVGGFMMITAGGDPEKFSKGKKTLLYAAIGFVVVLAANAVSPLIESLFK